MSRARLERALPATFARQYAQDERHGGADGDRRVRLLEGLEAEVGPRRADRQDDRFVDFEQIVLTLGLGIADLIARRG